LDEIDQDGGTAFLVRDKEHDEKVLHCQLCEQNYKVTIGEEKCEECRRDVIYADEDFGNVCCSCAFDPENGHHW
jgi:hypothetical protein